MYHHFSAHRSNLLVWSPDAVGSACFLVSSVLAELAVLHAVLLVRRSATLNLIGSVAFGISAIAAFVIPDTNEMLNASLATSMTLVGALCFLWAARILVKPPPWLLPRARGQTAAEPA
jgi:Zn-dependent alcohol dehydrogenase